MDKVTIYNDNRLFVLETIKYKNLKVYAAVQNILGTESISLIGYFKYSHVRKEWYFKPRINFVITIGTDFAKEITKYLDELNKQKW